jgi:2-dehydro-3-deoxyphosphooctonate aldolase (KDO 8-P synthase)
MFMAEKIKDICDQLEINWIFILCYDKDCRSTLDSFHGLLRDEGLKILGLTRKMFNITVVSDFSEVEDASAIGEVCDLKAMNIQLEKKDQKQILSLILNN